jgi:hypothetical protein
MEKIVSLEAEGARGIDARCADEKRASLPERQPFRFYRDPIRPQIFTEGALEPKWVCAEGNAVGIRCRQTAGGGKKSEMPASGCVS